MGLLDSSKYYTILHNKQCVNNMWHHCLLCDLRLYRFLLQLWTIYHINILPVLPEKSRLVRCIVLEFVWKWWKFNYSNWPKFPNIFAVTKFLLSSKIIKTCMKNWLYYNYSSQLLNSISFWRCKIIGHTKIRNTFTDSNFH